MSLPKSKSKAENKPINSDFGNEEIPDNLDNTISKIIDALYHFVQMLDLLTEECQKFNNKCYLASPYLPKMREAAYHVLKIMLENNKEDKDLMGYLKEYIREKKINLSTINNLLI